VRDAERAVIRERALLGPLGVPDDAIEVGELWSLLLERALPNHPVWTPTLRRMLDAGTLSTRIGDRSGDRPSRGDLRAVYAELAACLSEGRLFGVR